jgi:hypothetical protein
LVTISRRANLYIPPNVDFTLIDQTEKYYKNFDIHDGYNYFSKSISISFPHNLAARL